MKVLHLCLANFYVDNYAYQENMLPKYHKLMGCEVVVIASLVSYDEGGKRCILSNPGEYFSKDNFKVKRLNFKKPFRFLNEKLRIYDKSYSAIANERPDIIFIHGCQFWDIKQVRKYKIRFGDVKIYIDNHADFVNSATKWASRNILHKIIWKYCAKSIEPFTEKFYGVTPLRCDFLEKVYKVSHNKIQLLVLGADTEEIRFNQKNRIRRNIRNKLNISEDDFVLITGGKISKRKNVHLLMEAVQRLEHENVKLIVFGINNETMKSTIDDLSKFERIRHIGWIEPAKIYEYFLASDLAVFPGTHSVLWEQSVGSGIPGVFKYWKGMEHIDLGGNCRFLYNDQVSEIKNVLEDILNNRDEYQKMKDVAEKRGMHAFSYKEISRKSIEIV